MPVGVHRSVSQRQPYLAAHRGQPEGPANHTRAQVSVATDEDVVQGGQLTEHLGVLERTGDTAPGDLVRRQREQVFTVERDPARPRTVEPGDQVEDGRLAGAVGADQREDLSIADLDAELAQGGEAAEADREIFDAEHRPTLT